MIVTTFEEEDDGRAYVTDPERVNDVRSLVIERDMLVRGWKCRI